MHLILFHQWQSIESFNDTNGYEVFELFNCLSKHIYPAQLQRDTQDGKCEPHENIISKLLNL